VHDNIAIQVRKSYNLGYRVVTWIICTVHIIG